MRLLNKIKKLKVIQTSYHLLIVANISLIGFLWHFYGSISAYLQYGTKVTFAIEEPQDYQYQYPGITVCFKSVIPYWKLLERFPELGEDVDIVKNEMKSRNDSNFWTRSVSKNFTKIKETGGKLKDFYERKLKDELSVLEVLEDWGNDLGMRCRVYSYPIVENGKSIKLCDQISPVIETINYKFRCFTYFSQLNIGNNSESLFTTTVFRSQTDLESYNEDMAHIAIETNFSKPLHPFDDSFNSRITIHPSQMVPFPGFHLSKRLINNWGRHYDIFFSKTVSHLLEPPYATNCKKYDLKSDVQSYDMCLSICILDKYRDLCKCLPKLGLMYSTKYLRSDDKFCPNNNECQALHIRQNCAKNCKPNCFQEQYTSEIMSDIPWHDIKNGTAIKVGRKSIPDNVYRHSVAVSWVQLVSDIGGLGGLWLGFSVIAVAKVIICWLKDIKIKDKIQEQQITRI